MASLVIPDVDAAEEAGKLLDQLPTLWEEADLLERRKLLTAMLEARNLRVFPGTGKGIRVARHVSQLSGSLGPSKVRRRPPL